MLHRTFLICSCLIACCGFAQPSQKKTDSLKIVLLQHKARDSSRVLTLINYTSALFYVQPDSSLMKYADEALQIGEELKWNFGIARSLQLKAVVYDFFWADPVRALDCYQKALKINESIGNKEFQWNTLMNIGVIHFNLSEYEQALYYFNQAYAIVQQLKTQKNEDQLLMNIANAYSKLNQTTRAEEFYAKSIAIAEKSGNIQVIANALCSRGLVYRNEKKLDAAKGDLEKGITLAEKYNFKSILVVGLLNLAETSIDLKEYTTAERHAQEALQLSRQMHMRQLEVQSLGTLADLYSANGNAKKALAYYEQYQPIHDSLLNDETKQSLARMEMQYQFKQKEDSTKIENDKQQALAAAKLQRQHIVNNSITGGAVVLLLAGFISFLFYRKRRDAENQKQEAEFQTKVADTEMKALRAQMNPHFIFNSLNSIASYITQNETRLAAGYTVKFARLMRMVLENSEQKEITLADDLKALELYMQLECFRLRHKFSYEISVDQNINAEDTFVPPMILQPFVENSIWHGMARKTGAGRILVRIEREGEMIKCTVKDDGDGSAQPVAASEGKISMGLTITKARIDILNRVKNANGSMHIFSQEEGVTAEIKLPLAVAF